MWNILLHIQTTIPLGFWCTPRIIRNEDGKTSVTYQERIKRMQMMARKNAAIGELMRILIIIMC